MKFSATGFTSTLSLCLLLALGALWGGMPKVQAASLTIGVIGDYGSAYLGGASVRVVDQRHAASGADRNSGAHLHHRGFDELDRVDAHRHQSPFQQPHQRARPRLHRTSHEILPGEERALKGYGNPTWRGSG